MAIKHYIKDILVDGDMSGNLTSDVIQISGNPLGALYMVHGYSCQAVWTGTSPVGVLEIEVSIDGTNWVPITNSAIPVSGNTGTFLWNVEFPFYKLARMTYERTSGTGSLTITMLLLGTNS